MSQAEVATDALECVRAICFDLDNTLWDVRPVIVRAERSMYEFLKERYPRTVANSTLEALREARNRVALEHPQKEHDFTFLRKAALRNLALEHHYPDALIEEAFAVFIGARNEVTLYDDVMPALHTLRSRYRLFTASNGNADLQQIGIAHLFERSVAAREVGAAKPDPLIFQRAIEGTGLRMDETIYVGDDPLLDIVGARRAGMQSVWIDRDGIEWPAGLEPARHSVSSLTQLVDLLR